MAHRTIRARGKTHAVDTGTDESAEARFGRKVTPLDSGCWAYNGDLSKYGGFVVAGRGAGRWETVGAHRYSYETLVGPVPAGYHLHHKCHNPGCVNPSHLEPLTPAAHKLLHLAEAAAS